MYEFKVDLNGDPVKDATYRLTFDERDGQGKQRYTVRRIRGAEAVDPHAAGTVIAQGITNEPLPRHPVCAPGQAKQATHFGSSQMYCMRWVTRSRMARW
jgi:hypothetical protein